MYSNFIKWLIKKRNTIYGDLWMYNEHNKFSNLWAIPNMENTKQDF